MAHGRFDRVPAPQVFADRFGLRRGLDNDECAALYNRSGVVRLDFSLDFLLARGPFLFHFFITIRHLSSFIQKNQTSKRLDV